MSLFFKVSIKKKLSYESDLFWESLAFSDDIAVCLKISKNLKKIYCESERLSKSQKYYEISEKSENIKNNLYLWSLAKKESEKEKF